MPLINLSNLSLPPTNPPSMDSGVTLIPSVLVHPSTWEALQSPHLVDSEDSVTSAASVATARSSENLSPMMLSANSLMIASVTIVAIAQEVKIMEEAAADTPVVAEAALVALQAALMETTSVLDIKSRRIESIENTRETNAVMKERTTADLSLISPLVATNSITISSINNGKNTINKVSRMDSNRMDFNRMDISLEVGIKEIIIKILIRCLKIAGTRETLTSHHTLVLAISRRRNRTLTSAQRRRRKSQRPSLHQSQHQSKILTLRAHTPSQRNRILTTLLIGKSRIPKRLLSRRLK